MPVLKFDSRVDGECPFCKKTFWAGFTDGVPAVVHSSPPCPRFMELEVDEFLRAVNDARGLN